MGMKFKENFLWFKKGQEVTKEIYEPFLAKHPDILELWKPYIEDVEITKIDERLEEIAKDLKDDGKLNYSNNAKKKSPGRPKGKTKKSKSRGKR